MKKTIEYFTYKSEEMNLDLVEQAVQNIANRGFGAASLAVTLFTLFKYIAKEYAELEGKSDIINYVKIKAYKYVDGFVGIRGVSKIYSENMNSKDCCIKCTASEYIEIPSVTYKRK